MSTSFSPLKPALLALDWGTSSLRAFLLDAEGAVLQRRYTAQGLQALPVPGRVGFERVFAEVAGEWLHQWPHLPTIAGGMVGSAQGWKEAPYAHCPASLRELTANCVRVNNGLGGEIVITPGVLLNKDQAIPDVMRGEEIQIIGALAQNPLLAASSTLVLPGTHSKWVQLQSGRIDTFTSYMTGEAFALLSQHSILGRLMNLDKGAKDDAVAHGTAFMQGVAAARNGKAGDFCHQIFAARTLGLTGKLHHSQLKDYLSGVLIGNEVVSGLSRSRHKGSLQLIGEPALCQLYLSACAALDITVDGIIENPAPRGLWEIAHAQGLLDSQRHTPGGHHDP